MDVKQTNQLPMIIVAAFLETYIADIIFNLFQ